MVSAAQQWYIIGLALLRDAHSPLRAQRAEARAVSKGTKWWGTDVHLAYCGIGKPTCKQEHSHTGELSTNCVSFLVCASAVTD